MLESRRAQRKGKKSNAKLQKQVAEGGWEERAQGASGRRRDGGEHINVPTPFQRSS